MKTIPAALPKNDALGRLNARLARHTVGTLALLVVANLALPAPGVALKSLSLFRIPGVGWSYDFSTLALTSMMLSAALQCRLGDFAQLARRPQASAASLLQVYALGPALALATSAFGLGGFPQEAAAELRLGLFLVSLMPVAMTAAVWVRLAAGNVALLLALIAVTTLLSVVSVPLYSQLMPALAGTALDAVPVSELVKQLVLSVSLPLAFGLTVRRLASRWADSVQPAVTLLGTLGLYAALSTNVAGAAAHLRGGDLELLALTGVSAVGLNLGLFGVALLAARRLRAQRPGLSHDDAVALLFAGGMRSTGTAMVLGAAAFPAMPLVTVPAALYSISQQILAGYLVRLLQPGSALLRTPVGKNRRELDAQLRQRVLRQAGQLCLLVFRVVAPRGRAAPLAALMADVRRRLRGHDYVSLLGPDHFAVLLGEVPEEQSRKIARRLEAALLSRQPDLVIHWGHAEATTPIAVSQVVDLARLRATNPPRPRGVATLRQEVAS
ncbi:MAG TPA: bile acid:sodium symporter [Myxococcales bacterium]